MRNHETNFFDMTYDHIKDKVGKLGFEELYVIENLKLCGKYFLTFDSPKIQGERKIDKQQ